MNEKNVLVVGNGDIRRTVMQIMEELGFNVEGAMNGREALSVVGLAKETGIPFDLVITDYQMSCLNGIGLIRQLRTTNNITPIILLWDDLGLTKPEELEALKVTSLRKPFAAEQLQAAVETVLVPERRRETLIA